MAPKHETVRKYRRRATEAELQAMVGSRFGCRTVITLHPPVKGVQRKATCRCACGREDLVAIANLRRGACLACPSCAKILHGDTLVRVTPEWQAWYSMLLRCQDKTQPNYADYGGRGITVAAEWTGPDGFATFLQDVGRRPTSKHSLDRVNNDGNYTSDNVRWATPKQQARNKRNNRLIQIEGVERCLGEWAEVSGTHQSTIHGRLSRGWSPRDAVFGRSA